MSMSFPIDTCQLQECVNHARNSSMRLSCWQISDPAKSNWNLIQIDNLVNWMNISKSNSHAISSYSDVCINTILISMSNHFIYVQQCEYICILYIHTSVLFHYDMSNIQQEATSKHFVEPNLGYLKIEILD